MGEYAKFKNRAETVEEQFMTKTIATGMLFAALCVCGDDAGVMHERSSVPATARYEIVQSPVLVKNTFKLDKFTGQTWQLVRDKDDDVKWEPIPCPEAMKSGSPSAVRFQIFMGGRLARHTFLLDTQTGRTWQFTVIVNDKGDEVGTTWQAVIALGR